MVSGQLRIVTPVYLSFSRYVLSKGVFRHTNDLKNFEEWGKLVSAGGAQILDLYPMLRNLPAFLTPAYKGALKLGEKERELYMLNWMSTKNSIKDGTCHVSFLLIVQSAQLIIASALLQLRCPKGPKERRFLG